MNRIDYIASGGNEIFLSLESENSRNIFGFLRLRNILNPKRVELQDKDPSINNACIVRELHVYGNLVDIGNSSY